MDIQKLEKLSEMMEKGFLTKKEFETQKAILFNKKDFKETKKPESNELAKEEINWKNIGLAFLYTSLVYVPFVILIVYMIMYHEENFLKGYLSLQFCVIALVLIMFKSLKMDLYQNTSNKALILAYVFMFGPIELLFFFYDYLQIKSGVRLLKSDKRKQKKSKKVTLLVFPMISICIALCYVFLYFWVFSNIYRKKMLDDISQNYTCSNEQVLQEEVIPLLDNSLSEFGIKTVSFYETREVSYNPQKFSRVCQAMARFSSDEYALVEYSFIRGYINVEIIKVFENE